MFIGVNGGIRSLDETARHLQHVDGAMLGRAAYQTPALLTQVDQEFYGEPGSDRTLADVVMDLLPQIERWLADGHRLGLIVRPLLGLFHGFPGARRWRQILLAGFFFKLSRAIGRRC